MAGSQGKFESWSPILLRLGSTDLTLPKTPVVFVSRWYTKSWLVMDAVGNFKSKSHRVRRLRLSQFKLIRQSIPSLNRKQYFKAQLMVLKERESQSGRLRT